MGRRVAVLRPTRGRRSTRASASRCRATSDRRVASAFRGHQFARSGATSAPYARSSRRRRPRGRRRPRPIAAPCRQAPRPIGSADRRAGGAATSRIDRERSGSCGYPTGASRGQCRLVDQTVGVGECRQTPVDQADGHLRAGRPWPIFDPHDDHIAIFAKTVDRSACRE